jgi:hypothetical protein
MAVKLEKILKLIRTAAKEIRYVSKFKPDFIFDPSAKHIGRHHLRRRSRNV